MQLRQLFTVVLALGVGASLNAQVAPGDIEDPASFPAIVARVNGTEIDKDELIRRAEALKSQVPPSEISAGFYRRVLDDIVSGELLFQSVEQKGLLPTAAEVDAEFGTQSERFGGVEAFEAALAEEGLSSELVKLDIKKEMGLQKLVERELAPMILVSEEEKRTFYDGNTASMQQPLEFRAAHILILVDADAPPEAKQEGRTKAQALLSMIEMGQDFAELASKNSGDPGSKDNGGELPWMAEGQTVPPFEAAMKALEPGQLSGVVETEFGYHIIKLLERRGGAAVPYEDVHDRIEQYLKQQGLRERIQEAIEQLRVGATIEVFI